jgi:SAM-dependent methyltransferase
VQNAPRNTPTVPGAGAVAAGVHHPLDRNGFATRPDLATPQWGDIYAVLEREQDAFLARDGEFRPAAYQWPRDALHSWSRIWEYPYIYHHITACAGCGGGPRLVVVDVGSGITFFPTAIAKLGADVTCLDVDPVSVEGMQRAGAVLNLGTGKLDARVIAADSIPLADKSVDVIYSISVLEHTPEPTTVLREMVRVLRPGGYLLLTIDIDLRGDAAIGPAAYRHLTDFLNTALQPVHGSGSVHPLALLTSTTSPHAAGPLRGPRALLHSARQLVKPLFGRQRIPNPPYHLAVEGFCYRRA